MTRAAPMHPDDRRAALLDAAREVFTKKGYHAASVSDILLIAGVARGTFYNYFDSKRAVFQAVLEGLMESVEAVIQPIDVAGDIASQARDNIERILGAALDRGAWRLLFTEAIGIDAEGDALVRDFYARAAGRLERALRTGQAIGVVVEGDPRLLARCILGVVKEPIFQGALAGEELLVGQLAEQVYRLLIGGVIASGPLPTRQSAW